MKTISLTSLALALSLCAAPLLAQDEVATVPVRFAKGATGTTVKGAFSGYDSVNYTLSARAGQTMAIKIKGSSNANFNVFAPGQAPGGGTAMGSGAAGEDWSARLPATGAYTIQVFQMRASARRGERVAYTLSIGVK